MLKVFSLTEDTFVKFTEEESPHGPGEMSRVEPGPSWASAGINRYEKGKTWIRDWPYWYTEVVYVTRGHGKVTLSEPPYATSESTEVKAGDLFTIPKSMKVSFEALGDDVFEIVWAVPE